MSAIPEGELNPPLKQPPSTIPIAWVLRIPNTVGALFLVLVFVFSLLGKHFLLAELIGSFRYQLAALLIPFAVASLLLRQRILSLLLLGIIGWNAMTFLSVYWPDRLAKPVHPSIKIMSLNLLGDNPEHQRVIEVVRDYQPDVLMLLEYSNLWNKQLQPLHDQYPFRVTEHRWHGYGIAAFSKRPVNDVEVLQLTADQTDVPALVFQVDCGGQTVRLAGLHTMSPINRMRLDLRNSQMSEIGTYLTQSDQPTVLMGDFNCTPWSPFMRQLLKSSGYRDSRQGRGFHATWRADLHAILRIPIDHVLVSPAVDVYHREVGPECGSDHLPVIFRVGVKE